VNARVARVAPRLAHVRAGGRQVERMTNGDGLRDSCRNWPRSRKSPPRRCRAGGRGKDLNATSN